MTSILFLDANVYLSFFSFGKDDLEEMEKLVKLINDDEITLLTNTHLIQEVRRNREGKINDGYKELKSKNYGKEFQTIAIHMKR